MVKHVNQFGSNHNTMSGRGRGKTPGRSTNNPQTRPQTRQNRPEGAATASARATEEAEERQATRARSSRAQSSAPSTSGSSLAKVSSEGEDDDENDPDVRMQLAESQKGSSNSIMSRLKEMESMVAIKDQEIANLAAAVRAALSDNEQLREVGTRV